MQLPPASLLVSWHIDVGGDDPGDVGALLGVGFLSSMASVKCSTANSQPMHRHSAPRRPPERPQRSPSVQGRTGRESPAS